MSVFVRKQELLQKAQTTGLTKSERGELRELELWERRQAERARHHLEESVKTFEDHSNPFDTPRSRAESKGVLFIECPLCRKNRNIYSRFLREYNHMQRYPDDYCMKPHLHNDKSFNMMIRRPRIDLDKKDERMYDYG